MNKIFTHTWWMCLELFRQPSYFVATVAFPSLFYVIFAIPESKTIEASNTLLASFSCFAVFGVLFLQFGVGVSQERSTSWYHYLRTLPLKTFHLMTARFITAYIFASLSVGFLVLLSILFTKAELDFKGWLFFVSSLYGSLFGLF
jgi:ABC-2 type transport system permease protein